MTQATQKPRHILFILRGLRKNGASLSTLTTIQHLDPARYRPSLLILGPGETWPEMLEGLAVQRAYKPGASRVANLFYLVKVLWRESQRADVLMGGLEMTPTFLAAILGKVQGKPSLGFVRNSLPELLSSLPGFYTRLSKFIYPQVTGLVAISEGIKESVEELFPQLVGRVYTVYIPLDLAKVRRLAAAALPESAPQEPFMVAVGRLEPQKGFDVLLSAYAEVRRKGVLMPLVIVGEGGQEAALKDQAARLGVAEHVQFAGFHPNPYPWMKGAALFVSSSRFEGFCRVIAEALAVGTPVVATACPSGPFEVLEAGKAGILVKNEDADALATAIVQMLASPELQQRFAAYGPQRADAFTTDATVARFQDVLDEVAEKR